MFQSKAYARTFDAPSGIERLQNAVTWLLGPEPASDKHPGHLWARWIVLRALGLIYFSAFYSLLFQIKGLIGVNGLLPAADYLQAVASAVHGMQKIWFAPTLLWIDSSNHALVAICWIGLIASLFSGRECLAARDAPHLFRMLSFVRGCRAGFSGYQSDGMLLEAGFIALFFAPPGFWPRLGRHNAPSRASLFLLQWEWLRIYFESGVAKISKWRS